MATPATERRAFQFQPVNRERPSLPPSGSSSRVVTPRNQSEDNLERHLSSENFRQTYPAPYSPRSPDEPRTPPTSSRPPFRTFSLGSLSNISSGQSSPLEEVELDGTYENMGMKARPRGGSDHGRPALRIRADTSTYGLPSIPAEVEETPVAHKPPSTVLNSGNHSLPEELLTAILIPLPYLLGALLRPLTHSVDHSHHSANTEAVEEILEEVASTALPVTTTNSGLFDACALAAGTLVLVGLYGYFQHRRELDRRRGSSSVSRDPTSPVHDMFSWKYFKRLFLRMASVGLPFLAMVEIGGMRTGLFLLAGAAEGLIAPDTRAEQIKMKSWSRTLQTHRWVFGLFMISLLADLFVFRTNSEPSSTIRGYAALVKPILLLQSPMAPTTTPLVHPGRPMSPLISSPAEAITTIVAGLLLGGVTLTLSSSISNLPTFDIKASSLFILSVAAAAGLLAFSRPSSLRTIKKPGLALGLFLCSCFALATARWSNYAAPAAVLLCALTYFAVQFDTRVLPPPGSAPHSRAGSLQSTTHIDGSAITQFLLRHTKNMPLIHSILAVKESRRITYFMLINLTFMFIQTFYSIVSGSLGLLSDSIHMLFDCVGLFAGLVAAVMSKWPANEKFPYGYGKVEVLSGLGNGIFLMIISIEIIWESLERVMEGAELKRMNELLLVSIAGLAVNLLGLQLTGHHHHHGHGHSHGHSHAHEHDQASTGVSEGLNGTSLAGVEKLERKAHAHHHHGHDNENMAGIYLHILADTMGSVAVIVSTLLTQYTGWYGWDPLASFVIAVLIIAASYPLVVGSAKQLLLTMPEDVEYMLRNTLQGISELRGVSGYAVPRFWLDESQAEDPHDHDHDHHHHDDDHSHQHHDHSNHTHDSSRRHTEPHLHLHDEKHTHDCDHDHAHSHDTKHNHSVAPLDTPTRPSHRFHLHPHSHTPSKKATPPHSHDHEEDHSTHHHHDHHDHAPAPTTPKLLGVIHIIASPRADLEDVRKRVDAFLRERNMDVLVHVEREGMSRCWCGGSTHGAHGRARSVVVM